jgi:hypothetical protein
MVFLPDFEVSIKTIEIGAKNRPWIPDGFLKKSAQA